MSIDVLLYDYNELPIPVRLTARTAMAKKMYSDIFLDPQIEELEKFGKILDFVYRTKYTLTGEPIDISTLP